MVYDATEDAIFYDCETKEIAKKMYFLKTGIMFIQNLRAWRERMGNVFNEATFSQYNIHQYAEGFSVLFVLSLSLLMQEDCEVSLDLCHSYLSYPDQNEL